VEINIFSSYSLPIFNVERRFPIAGGTGRQKGENINCLEQYRKEKGIFDSGWAISKSGHQK
jgi:hypothetical protein